MIRALFYRGRHHICTAQRDDAGALVTVATIAERIRRQAREAAIGSASIGIVPDFLWFSPEIAHAVRAM